jgi:hypothetical protein
VYGTDLADVPNQKVCKIFSLSVLIQLKNYSRGVVHTANRNISTRGIKSIIYFEDGKLFALNWWCSSALHHIVFCGVVTMSEAEEVRHEQSQ